MSIVESHKNYQPRLIAFYFIFGALLVVLASGLTYRQLIQTGVFSEREKLQNQRRVLVPGPRGNIYDREGRLLVGNRPRFSVVLLLAELRDEFRTEYIRIVRNYRELDRSIRPKSSDLESIARNAVAQRYLDQVNQILGRSERVDSKSLGRHFRYQLLLPYILVDDLAPDEYARLLEQLPVASPLQVYSSSTRYYPHRSLAAHTLGYVGVDSDISAEDFPGGNLTTFKMKGSLGRDGLEKEFDSQLEGQPGGTIYRVDPAGYRVNPPLERRLPVQGKNLVTSLDIDLQAAAEKEIGDQIGGAVALDVRTGEVLVLASKPDYNLSEFSPHLSHAAVADIEARGAWLNRATAAFHPPGSTFKILSAIAGLRAGTITTDQPIVDCEGYLRVAGRIFPCENGNGHHGEILLADAITYSCDVYFYTVGLRTSADVIAAEAHRFHLDQRSGIDLPGEPGRATVPNPEWKERTQNMHWFPGDTANMAIGQGYVLESPLNMACFTASLARGETVTVPTLIHRDDAPTQHTEPIGLTPAQRVAVLAGMEGCTTVGTARILTQLAELRVPGVRIAGKTGTAQIPGNKNAAWFICFAPIERPEIAVAVMIEGDTPGEDFGGGRHAAPVASAILRKYFEKKQSAGAARFVSN